MKQKIVKRVFQFVCGAALVLVLVAGFAWWYRISLAEKLIRRELGKRSIAVESLVIQSLSEQSLTATDVVLKGTGRSQWSATAAKLEIASKEYSVRDLSLELSNADISFGTTKARGVSGSLAFVPPAEEGRARSAIRIAELESGVTVRGLQAEGFLSYDGVTSVELELLKGKINDFAVEVLPAKFNLPAVTGDFRVRAVSRDLRGDALLQVRDGNWDALRIPQAALERGEKRELLRIDLRDGRVESGKSEVRCVFEDIAATSEDITLQKGRVDLRFPRGGGTASPSLVEIGKLDYGIPLEDISIAAELRGDRIRLTKAESSVLGSRVSVAPTVLRLPLQEARIDVTINGLELARVLELYPQERMEMSGTIDGAVMVVYAKKQIGVPGGRFSAREPGGFIKAQRGTLEMLEQREGEQWQLIRAAFENYLYSSLEGTIEYKPTGELTVQASFRGVSPALNNKRPLHVNISVEENIPKLLQSLRMIRRGPKDLEHIRSARTREE